jgi:hypothetical protein
MRSAVVASEPMFVAVGRSHLENGIVVGLGWDPATGLSTRELLSVVGTRPQRVWAIAGGDLDGDGAGDVVVLTETELHAWFADPRVPTWSLRSPPGRNHVTVSTDDIDGDGITEIVAGSGLDLQVYDRYGALERRIVGVGPQAAVGEFDGDTTSREIVTEYGVIVDGRTGTREGELRVRPRALWRFTETNPAVAVDVDGDGIDEFAFLDGVRLWVLDMPGGQVRWSWQLPPGTQPVGLRQPPWLAPIDADGDGTPELAVVTASAATTPVSPGGAIHVLDGASGALVRAIPPPPGIAGSSTFAGCYGLSAWDHDGDGHDALLYLGFEDAYLIDPATGALLLRHAL